MPAAKLSPTSPRITAVPPVIYSQPFESQPSITVMAPEFLDKLMWNKFSNKMKIEIKKKGFINLKHGDYEYPITYQLIKDGKKNKILNKKISQNISVTMVHGSKDKSVPVIYSKKVLKIFQSKKKKLVIVKNGDHSLSSPKWLKILKKELKLIIS